MYNLSKNNKSEYKISHSQLIEKRWKGSISFQESLQAQEELKALALRGSLGFLGFESAKPVITKGLRATSEDIIWSKEDLKHYDFEEFDLKRGGQATLHSPGQLVIYPVINIAAIGLKLKEFIVSLEKTTQDVLKDLNIISSRTEEYAGLCTEKGKIAFFGVHISEGISQHGLSINVNNNLNLFASIKSCGALNRPHDRVCEYNFNISTEDLFFIWIEKFIKNSGI